MRNHRILSSLLIAMFLLMGIVGCSKDSSNSYGMSPSPTPNPTPRPNVVLMSGMAFSPTTMTVAKGTTVTWENDDAMAHTSTSNTGVWDTGNIPPGGSKTTTFSSVGTFPYHCVYHSNMTGTIVVQ